MEHSRALLIRKTRFGESSLIVTWFSKEFGKIKTVVKGAARPKSPFAGKLDLFFLCELGFKRAKSGELHPISEVQVIESFPEIRSTYGRTLCASYFAELTELASESEHPHPELFDLLVRALGFLDKKDPNLKAVTFFEAELAKLVELETGQHPTGSVERRLGNLLGRLPTNRGELMARIGETN